MAYFSDSDMKMVGAMMLIGAVTTATAIGTLLGALLGAPFALFQHDWMPIIYGAGGGAFVGLLALPVTWRWRR